MPEPFPEPSPQALRGMEERREQAPDGPVFAWVAPTGRCNLFCVHCPIRIMGKEPEDAPDLSATTLERVATEILPGLASIKIGGNNNGEPLHARDFDAFFERLFPEGGGTTPWLITNGTLLEPDRIERIVERGGVIDFSMDAVSADVHKMLRGKGHEALLEALRASTEIRDRHPGTGARVWASLTALRTNLEEIPKVVDFAVEHGLDGVRVSHLQVQSEAQRYESLVYHRSEANRMFAACRARVEGTRTELIAPEPFEQPRIRTDAKVQRHPPERRDCVHPWTSVSIDEKGLVHPCCASDQVLGDLREQSFAAIWNGRAYRRLRRKVNSDRPPLYCSRCCLRGAAATQAPDVPEEDLLASIGPSRTIDPSQFAIYYLMEMARSSRVARAVYRIYLVLRGIR